MDTARLAQSVAAIEGRATRILTRFEHGTLAWRTWPGPENAPHLLLAHGGSGSWTHWFLNIPSLVADFRVTTIDLPGLGDSDKLPKGYTAQDAVDAVVAGLDEVMGDEPFHLCAFSWGCALMSQLSARSPERFRSMMLVGPASLGDIERRGGMLPLIRRTPEMSVDEVYAANRENLARLMIHDRSVIDDLSVYLQTLNTRRARFNSPQFVRTTLTLDGVGSHRVPLKVVYGDQDAPALPDVAGKEALFREVRPDVAFELVPGAGHWLQYEAPTRFHSILTDWTSRFEATAPSA